METFERARRFIYRNARPLDLARWQFHFEGGSREAVLNALSCYQNADGGFGHGLEADAWNPASTPIQTWTATEVLLELGVTDPGHPMIRDILRYLGACREFDGRFWYNTVPGNNDYPHAPWWHVADGDAPYQDYNPTACLAGFVVRYADRGSDLRRTGLEIARAALAQLAAGQCRQEMHNLFCFVQLLEYCGDSELTAEPQWPVAQEMLRRHVRDAITKDTALWGVSYICKPSQLFTRADSVYCADNREMAEYECAFIVRTQLEDGSWSVPWSWADYPEEWAVSKNWWKSDGILRNLLYLKGMNKL